MKKKRQKSSKKSKRNNNKKNRQQKTPKIDHSNTCPPNQAISCQGNFSNIQLLFITKPLLGPNSTEHNISALSIQFFGPLLFNNILAKELGDKTKYLHNIRQIILTLLNHLNHQKPAPKQIEYPSTLKLGSRSSPDLSSDDLIHFNESQFTQSCANIFLNTRVGKLKTRSRPSYIIERDCHVFGGCSDEDAEDEFFISSGAVYQSWPYIYEPGFNLQPLPSQRPSKLPSTSDTQINYPYQQQIESNSNHPNQYSLQNYGLINLRHIKNHSMSTFSASDLSDSDSSDDDDDSDSYRAYKRRHAVGLTYFCNNQSNSSLSDLGGGGGGKMNKCGNLFDSSDNLYGKSEEKTSLRLTTSNYGLEKSSKNTNFLSCANNLWYSSNNLIF